MHIYILWKALYKYTWLEIGTGYSNIMVANLNMSVDITWFTEKNLTT